MATGLAAWPSASYLENITIVQRRWKPWDPRQRRSDPSCSNYRFDKCGGKDFALETCCPAGFECVDIALLEGRFCLETGRPF